MTERNIPITIEVKEDSPPPPPSANRSVSLEPESDNEDKDESKLSKSLEELSVGTRCSPTSGSMMPETLKTPPIDTTKTSPIPENSSPKVRVKPAPEHEYLKGFDVLEKRDGNSILSEYSLPNSDILERIILVIDRAQDENYTPFVIGSQKYTPLSMVKRAISIFIKLKLGINPYHEFAIVTMNENRATLVLEFTSDLRKLIECLNRISECETEDIFNLNTVFEIIEDAILPEPFASLLPPPYVLRTIIFYGRSYTMPQITRTNKIEALLSHPFSVCDVLMTHEPVEASNRCQEIFDILQGLDQKGIAYFFPVCRDLRRMHRCTGKLLAHPLQRPIQKLIKN